MTPPRYFILTGGATPHDAIDYVESRGHRIIETRLTQAASIALYGICEVEPPANEGDPDGH
jgi:hypothetical protein